MNEDMLIFAIGEIDDSYISRAGKRLSHKRKGYKIAYIIAAVMVLIISTLATAMAVNEEFRGAMFRLFDIGITEKVPDVDAADKYSGIVSVYDVSDKVKCRYIKTGQEQELIGSGSLIFNRKEGRFYDVMGQSLVPLETKLYSHDISDISIKFYYVVYDGELIVQTIEDERKNENPILYSWECSTIEGNVNKVWVTVFKHMGDGIYSAYPYLADINSNEVEDVFEGVDLQNLECFGWRFSQDSGKAIVIGLRDGIYGEFFADSKTKCVIKLEGMTDSFFADAATIVGLTKNEDKSFSLVGFDIEKSQRTVIADNIHFDNGELSIITASCCKTMLALDEEENVCFINVCDGRKIILPGLTQKGELYASFSRDGKKMLLGVRYEGLFTTLGIADIEQATIKYFKRENTHAQCEDMLGWLSNKYPAVLGAGQENCLYLYDFGV